MAEELTTEQLRPCDHPDGDFKQALLTLRRNEARTVQWMETNDAINCLRRLVAFHADTTIIPALHAVVSLFVEQVENLRSTVSKNALMGLGEMFRTLKRQMDPEIDHVLAALLKKFAEKSFLADEADKTLNLLCENVTDTKYAS